MPVNVVLDRKNELIILETQKDFSQIILRNLVGYTSEEKEDSTISYSIPPYPNNCFVLYCLFVKSPKTFNVSDEVLEGIKNASHEAYTFEDISLENMIKLLTASCLRYSNERKADS